LGTIESGSPPVVASRLEAKSYQRFASRRLPPLDGGGDGLTRCARNTNAELAMIFGGRQAIGAAQNRRGMPTELIEVISAPRLSPYPFAPLSLQLAGQQKD
jgi:hypothetical protein